jgi:recombination protein U
MAGKQKKKKDEGKLFERDIKASIPPEFFVERYKDDTAGFFGVSNPADFRLYKLPYTFLWELKTHKGKSIPLSKIRNSQLKGMNKASTYIGVYCGFLLNYRDLEETYYIDFKDLVTWYYTLNTEGDFVAKSNGRKSIPVEWCREYGERIQQTKKIVRYSYDLRSWLERYYVWK